MDQKTVTDHFSYDPLSGSFRRKKKTINGNPNPDGEAGWVEDQSVVSYRRVSFKGKRYFVHNLIWLYMTGFLPLRKVDHIDGEGLNNKWENLRLVDERRNMENKRRYANNKSGYVGVYYRKDKGVWHAQIGRSYLGSFASVEDALMARKKAERERNYHKNHGRVMGDKN